MKSRSVMQQLNMLLIAFSLMLPAMVLTVSYVAQRSEKRIRESSRRHDNLAANLFKLIDDVATIEGLAQRLVRERDPDVLEKLIANAEVRGVAAHERLNQMGAGGGAISAFLNQLLAANLRSKNALMVADQAEAQRLLIDECNPAFEKLLAKIGEYQATMSKQETEASVADARSLAITKWIVWAVSGLLSAGMTGVGILWLRSIRRGLLGTIQRLTEISSQTSEFARQVASVSHAQAEGATEQAASLEETAASTQQVQAMAAQNRDNSREAAELMDRALPKLEESTQAVAEMRNAIENINASSRSVSKIIRVIDEIAFQTNILALNAAVEAARAGEAGAGFSVVADEVRSLALRSAQAASETTGLIEESIRMAGDGQAQMNRIVPLIRDLSEDASAAGALVKDVRAASEEQARGITQIANSLSSIENVTQQAAASAEQSAAAAAEMVTQSETLNETVLAMHALVGFE